MPPEATLPFGKDVARTKLALLDLRVPKGSQTARPAYGPSEKAVAKGAPLLRRVR